MTQPTRTLTVQPATPAASPQVSPVSRRSLFAGASALGAIAATATLVPSLGAGVAAPSPVAKLMPTRGGGYSLTEHVKRYYKTTLV